MDNIVSFSNVFIKKSGFWTAFINNLLLKDFVMSDGVKWLRRRLYMTDQSGEINDTAKGNKIVISDTVFLSSFLWRNQFGIVTKLFTKLGMDIVVPRAVIEKLEYSIRTRERLQTPLIRLNNKKEKVRGAGNIYIRDIDSFSDMGIKYNELKESMGQGESAAWEVEIDNRSLSV